MTFEEFFSKKRIDLVALQAAEPGLYAEFKKHFAQMGEKSFDHTKKYWFNKLRSLYHLAPGLKPEKLHQENQLAQQTVVETLTETIPAPSTGFKPRFKPGMAAKSAETSNIKDPLPKDSATATPEVNEAAATKDQNPPFEQEKAAMQDMAEYTPRTTDTTEVKEEQSAQKPGFKPRFNMKMTKGDAPQTKDFEKVPEKTDEASTPAPEATAPKPGFKPRFNMKTMAPKPAEETENKPAEAEPPVAETSSADDVKTEPTPETTAPKPGFKPRFNMKTMAPKPAEETENKPAEAEQPVTEAGQVNDTEKPADEKPAAPKVGFKPRFNAKTTKPQSPPEE